MAARGRPPGGDAADLSPAPTVVDAPTPDGTATSTAPGGDGMSAPPGDGMSTSPGDATHHDAGSARDPVTAPGEGGGPAADPEGSEARWIRERAASSAAGGRRAAASDAPARDAPARDGRDPGRTSGGIGPARAGAEDPLRTRPPLPRDYAALTPLPPDERTDQTEAAPLLPRLDCIAGNDRGSRFPLPAEGGLSIGRGGDNDVVLADIAVSRRHLVVERDGDGYRVRDLSSGNGTFVNGDPVQSAPLRDGDQIEAGNTLLRFSDPAALARPVTPPAPPAAAEAAAPPAPHRGAPRGPAPEPPAPPPPQGLPPDPATLSAPLAPPRAAARLSGAIPGVVRHGLGATPSVDAPSWRDRVRALGTGMLATRRNRLLVFGSLAVALFLVAIGLVKRRMPEEDTSARVAQERFVTGVEHFKAERWDLAGADFEAVLALVPGDDKARRYAEQARAEAAAAGALGEAEQALAAGDLAATRAAIGRVPADSVQAERARKLAAAADEARADQLVADALKVKDGGDADQAMALVEEALRLRPEHQAARALSQSLRAEQPKSARRRPAPRARAAAASGGSGGGGGGGGGGAVAGVPRKARDLYRAQDFEGAAAVLRDEARRLGGRSGRRLEVLADQVAEVGRLWRQASQAEAGAPGRAVQLYEQARDRDRAIEISRGGLGSPIAGALRRAARSHAQSALVGKRYEESYAAARKAIGYGVPAADLANVSRGLDAQARTLYERAYTLRRSDPTQAHRMFSRVLKLVPEDNTWADKARTQLASMEQERKQDVW